MNKFLKRTLIFAMILLGIGIIICIICTAVGGAAFLNNMKTIVTEETNISEQLSNINFDGNISLDNLQLQNGTIDCDFDNDYSTHSGTFTDDSAADASDIQDLHVDMGGGTCTITVSKDNDFHVIGNSTGEYQYYTKSKTFYVTGFQQKNVSNLSQVIKDNHIEIQIPKDFEFQDISIELGAGEMTIDSLICEKNISMEIGAGNVTVKELYAQDAEFEIGAGNLTVQNGTIEVGSFEVGLGNLIYAGNIEKDLSASCGMGNIELTLAENQKDHNYQLSCAMGNITVGRNDYSGAAFEQELDYDAKYTYTLDCAMGNIDVVFQ